MKKSIILSLVLAAALPTVSLADAASSLLTKVSGGQAKIIQEFNGIGNLKGFVVAPVNGQGQNTIVYVDKNGKYLVSGNVIDAQGQNVTQNDFQKYVTDAMAPKVISAAAQTTWIGQGNPKAPHQAYVIVEPNCIACHMLHKALLPKIKSGQLYVRWIMVAFLKPDSEGKAAAILQAKDPAKAFDQDEIGFNEKTESGSIQPAKNISNDTESKLKANMAFMQKYNFISTPVIIYQDKAHKAQIMNGFVPGKALDKLVNSMSTIG